VNIVASRSSFSTRLPTAWRQRPSAFGFLQFLFFFFLKKVAQVAIVGNKTEPKLTINSDKTEKKIIHNNLLRSLKFKKNCQTLIKQNTQNKGEKRVQDGRTQVLANGKSPK
jgi:hypothetical protein